MFCVYGEAARDWKKARVHLAKRLVWDPDHGGLKHTSLSVLIRSARRGATKTKVHSKCLCVSIIVSTHGNLTFKFIISECIITPREDKLFSEAINII